jgi:hypothetical protein
MGHAGGLAATLFLCHNRFHRQGFLPDQTQQLGLNQPRVFLVQPTRIEVAFAMAEDNTGAHNLLKIALVAQAVVVEATVRVIV